MKVEQREVQRRVEHFKAVARQAGVKLTRQRLDIFRVVAASLEHPSAEAIFQALRPDCPTVSLDTIYRTLWLLQDLGLLATLGSRRESVRFDANLAPHHHYVCVRCGLVRDFESEEYNVLRLPDAVRELGRVIGTHVEVRGICQRCAAQLPSQPGPAAPQPPSDQEQDKP